MAAHAQKVRRGVIITWFPAPYEAVAAMLVPVQSRRENALFASLDQKCEMLWVQLDGVACGIRFQWELCEKTNRLHAQGVILFEENKCVAFAKLRGALTESGLDGAHIEPLSLNFKTDYYAWEYPHKTDTYVDGTLRWERLTPGTFAPRGATNIVALLQATDNTEQENRVALQMLNQQFQELRQEVGELRALVEDALAEGIDDEAEDDGSVMEEDAPEPKRVRRALVVDDEEAEVIADIAAAVPGTPRVPTLGVFPLKRTDANAFPPFRPVLE